MYYSTHIITGAAVGYVTGDVVSGFAAGLVSHAILDMIPHHDVQQIRYCLGDIASGSLFFLLFLIYGKHGTPLIAGAIGGILPDLEVPLFYFNIVKRKYFPSHSGAVTHRQASFLPGLMTQVAIAAIGLWIII